jgi:hypothetical protein
MISALDQSLVKPARPVRVLKYPKGVTRDIIKVVMEVQRTDRDDTEDFAKQIPPTYEGLRTLYWFLKNEITYKEDPEGEQWIQTPSYLMESGVGDCKSLAVFIASVLWNMGLDYIIRFTTDDPDSRFVTHVYVVAILPNGRKVIIDTVLGENLRKRTGNVIDYFDREGVKYKQQDFKIKNTMTKIYKLGAVKSLDQAYQALLEFDQSIDDSIITEGMGDVTLMTQGQFDRYIISERMDILARQSAGRTSDQYQQAAQAIRSGSFNQIGALDAPLKKDINKFLRRAAAKKQMAFKMPPLSIPKIEGLFSKIKDIGKGVIGLFKKAFKKLMNFLTKGMIAKMAPYFIFLFAKGPTKNKEFNRRRTAQLKTFNWISKVSKFEKSKLTGLLYNGILDATGKAPQNLLNDAAKSRIAGSGNDGKIGAWAAAAAKAVQAALAVVAVVNKIKQLFKKDSKEAGTVSEHNSSDLRILEDDIQNENSTPGNQGSGNGRQGQRRDGSKGRPRDPANTQSGAAAMVPLILLTLLAS